MMLSGFGICAGYLERFQTGGISLEKFYARRYSKVLPFFLVTTLIGVIAEHSLRGVAEGIIELTLVFGFLPNNSNCFNVNGVCWTLGTIFAFYLLFPFISVLLKNKKRAWLALVAATIVQILCEALFMTDGFVVDNYINRTNILYSMPFFLTGGLLYIFRGEICSFVKGRAQSEDIVPKADGRYKAYACYKKERLKQWYILLACIIATVLYYILPDMAFGISIIDQKTAFVFALWCVYAIGAKSFVLNNCVLKVIAKYSMEIYLSHMIVLRVLQILRVTELMNKSIMSFLIMAVLLLATTIGFILVVDLAIKWTTGKANNFQRIFIKGKDTQSGE